MSCEVWYETLSQQPGSKLTQEASRAPCPMTEGFFQARQRSGQPSSPGSPWGVPSFHLCMQTLTHTHTLHCFPGFSSPPSFFPPIVTLTAVSGCLYPRFSPAPSASVGLPPCRHPEGGWERRWYLHCGFSHVQVPGPSFLPLATLLGARWQETRGWGRGFHLHLLEDSGGGWGGKLGASPRVILMFAQV